MSQWRERSIIDSSYILLVSGYILLKEYIICWFPIPIIVLFSLYILFPFSFCWSRIGAPKTLGSVHVVRQVDDLIIILLSSDLLSWHQTKSKSLAPLDRYVWIWTKSCSSTLSDLFFAFPFRNPFVSCMYLTISKLLLLKLCCFFLW